MAKGSSSHWIYVAAAVAVVAGGVWWYELSGTVSGHGGNVTITSTGSISAASTPTGFACVSLPAGSQFTSVSYTSPGGTAVTVPNPSPAGSTMICNVGATPGTVVQVSYTDSTNSPLVSTITFY
jgi:hypothetical protein